MQDAECAEHRARAARPRPAARGAPIRARRSVAGERCWYNGHQGHTLRAQELADWLRKDASLLGLGQGPIEVRHKVTAAEYLGRSGLVFFRNFWGEGNQGDHIDLWDGDELRAGAPDYFERSEQVWFWPLPAVGEVSRPSR